MLVLRTLGSVLLLDRTIPQDIQPKRLALLVYLQRRANGSSLRRDQLVACFWPDSDDEHARGALRQSLTALRKQLGPETIATTGEEEVGLRAGALPCDATEFEEAIRAGSLVQACDLYKGPFLAGFHASGVAAEFDQWVDAERVRLARLAAMAASSLADDGEKAGDLGTAIRWVRRAAEVLPDDERLVARLISLLDRHGDRAGALQTYAQLSRRLRDEFSAEPSPETRALMQALRQRSTPPPLAALPSVTPPRAVASGSHPPPAEGASPRRRVVWAGLAGALAAVALFMILGQTHQAASPPPVDRVAVVPFRTIGADTAVTWLGEGVAELLAIRLSGDPGLPIVAPDRVIRTWQRQAAGDSSGAGEDALAALATAVGAGSIIAGSVTGGPGHLTLTAWTLRMPDEKVMARASVTGSADRIAPLVDGLAVQLLGSAAGIDERRLVHLTSASLTAVRAFLRGRDAVRAGRFDEAMQQFGEAIQEDSTFALAGLNHHRVAVWVDGDPDFGKAIARAHRDRLTIADRALLDDMDAFTSWPHALASSVRLVQLHPDMPEAWYGLGDLYMHWGGLAEVDQWPQRAEDAFRRGWSLDSAMNPVGLSPPLAQPLLHLIELAHMRDDSAEVRRLAARILAVDSSSLLGRVARWHVAALEGDASLDDYWKRGRGTDHAVSNRIVMLIGHWGLGASDYARANKENLRRMLASRPPEAVSFAKRVVALNGGRPSEVPEGGSRQVRRAHVLDAISWGGDSSLARKAVWNLEQSAAGAMSHPDSLSARDADRCVLALWRAHRREPAEAMRFRDQLAASLGTLAAVGSDTSAHGRYLGLCTALVDALVATALGDRGGPQLVAVADSLARTDVFQILSLEGPDRIQNANLLIAALWEAVGDRARAVRAVRRRGGNSIGLGYLSSFRREEGRLAALEGDTAGALRAYRHYLMFRPDPEPSVRPEVERVRQEVASLSQASTHASSPAVPR